jgi:hypothetical protein
MIHISFIRTHARSIKWSNCPDCKRHSPFANFHQEWYGSDSTCMRCGRSWSDGEWMPLPFCRGAREQNKANARKRWKRGLDRSIINPTP